MPRNIGFPSGTIDFPAFFRLFGGVLVRDFFASPDTIRIITVVHVGTVAFVEILLNSARLSQLAYRGGWRGKAIRH